MKKRLLLVLALFLLPFVSADASHETNVENYYPIETWDVFWAAVMALTVFTIIAIYAEAKLNNLAKKLLFIVLAVIVIAATCYFIGTTLYINSLSVTKGPVHWHNDFELWMCGEKIDLKDPKGLSNKIGSPVFHEHDDDRVHVEGVVLDMQHVSLSSFLDVVGGSMTQNSITIPTNDGSITKNNGDLCNGAPGQLQVFVYRVDNPKDHKKWIYTQRKETDFENYVMAPHIHVPPGDCVIVEFDQPKERTDKVCATYEVGIEQGDLTER